MKKFNYITEPDNFLQILVRVLSTLIVRLIAGTPISPNHVTIIRAIFNLAALLLFVLGDYRSLVLAFFAFQINEVLDHVDGDLARFKNLQSKKGVYLEHLVDVPGSTMYGLFGLAVVLGIYRQTQHVSIIFIFIAICTGFAIKTAYACAFGLVQKEAGLQHSRHGTYESFAQCETLKQKINIVAINIIIWQNQLILWAALLQKPVEKLWGINSLFWAMVVIAGITQISLLRTIYRGYKNIYITG